MEGLFGSIPVELITQMIKYLDYESINTFMGTLEELTTFRQLDSENNWRDIFRETYPSVYNEIKHLISIDHTLRTHRYQRIWRTWYTDFKILERDIDDDINEIVDEFILSLPNHQIININLETINIIHALRLYKRSPHFYMNVVKYLPNNIHTKTIAFESIEKSDTYGIKFFKVIGLY